jgi:hypothetical protein
MGGFFMFPLVLLGVVGVLGTIGGLLFGVLSRSRTAPLAAAGALVFVGLLTAGVGAAAYAHGLSRVSAALAHVDPQYVGRLRAQGELEAKIPLQTGATAAGLPLLGAGVLALIGLGRPPRPRRS